MNNKEKLYCPFCKVNEMDWDYNFGACDKCIGIDDESWNRKMVEKEQKERFAEMKLESSRKEVWAAIYGRLRISNVPESEKSYKATQAMRKICKEVKAWYWKEMDQYQANKALGLTDYLTF